ncbi:MAG TPA: HD domain-containing protein [Deltaproteobacteria bacterium]|nr:HD domain-containing protein [Deltaproteobacteria bacterium]
MSDEKARQRLLGGKLIRCLYQLIHSSRIYQDNNQLIIDGVSQCVATLVDLSREGEVTIQVWRGRFYVNGEKLLYQRDTIAITNELAEYFIQRQIGGLRFLVTTRDDLQGNFMAFVRLIDESQKHDDPPAWLDYQAQAKGIHWVEVSRKLEEKPADLEPHLKEKALDAYFHALNMVKEVADKASRGIAGVRKARRLAQTIVDLIHEDSTIMLALATIRDYDDYTYTHSVNVAMLASCLGRYVGMSQVSLEHLTVCGLFHDLGKVGIPKDILHKEGKLNDEEWNTMRRHPLIGVRQIIHLRAPQTLRSRIILGPFEHHLNPDMTGYPRTHFMKGVSLMGKILRIVDVYEALTSERVYRPRAFTPDEALRRMWSEGGRSFDVPLLKCFIAMMGIYPIGTVVELQSRELGMVMEYPDESRKDRPLIVLLKKDGSGGYTRGEEVNLASPDVEGASPRMNIVKGIHASTLGIQPSQILLQDVRAA